MGTDYGSLGSPGPVLNFNTPPTHIIYSCTSFLGCPLGSIGGGPEKDRCFVFGFWALSITPRGYALPAGDPSVLSSPSLRVLRTSLCPRTAQPSMFLPPLEDIVWLLTENEGPS